MAWPWRWARGELIMVLFFSVWPRPDAGTPGDPDRTAMTALASAVGPLLARTQRRATAVAALALAHCWSRLRTADGKQRSNDDRAYGQLACAAVFRHCEAGKRQHHLTQAPERWTVAVSMGAALPARTLLALHVTYHWDHARAVVVTAERAAMVHGIARQGSLFVNYVFRMVAGRSPLVVARATVLHPSSAVIEWLWRAVASPSWPTVRWSLPVRPAASPARR
jgi:hypothetical protein